MRRGSRRAVNGGGRQAAAHETRKAAGVAPDGLSENWLPFVHRYRTLCLAPPPEVKGVFSDLKNLVLAAACVSQPDGAKVLQAITDLGEAAATEKLGADAVAFLRVKAAAEADQRRSE